MAQLTAGRSRQSTGGPGAGASRAIAGILVILMIGSASSARGGPDLVSLLETLNLGTYTPGDGPPAFTAQTLSGEGVSLASLRGRVVLLNFWATWCRECRPEMPVLERLHRELARQGLAVLGIDSDDVRPSVLDRAGRTRQLRARSQMALASTGPVVTYTSPKRRPYRVQAAMSGGMRRSRSTGSDST
jgi:thiol-disulfide isomerase/thioredoxin